MNRNMSSVVAHHTRSRKPILLPPLQFFRQPPIWVNASSTKNYMINDTLVDWLQVTSTTHGPHTNRKLVVPKQVHHSSCITPKPLNMDNFKQFILSRGHEFEAKLIEYIHHHKIPVVSISEHITDETVERTKHLMKQGTPVIHSAPVRNTRNKTRGVIDLLVRSDYLDKIVSECPLTPEEISISAPKLGGDYHYVVIDIKFSTLPLRSDGIHLLNSNYYPAYKAQVCIYNQAIGLIQGYTPRYAYILGRRWSCTKRNVKHFNDTCLDRLGVIDFEGVDIDYVKRTKDAIRWVKDVKKNGHRWSVSPPSRQELYPNMCVDSGDYWQREKEQISEDIGEITNVWYCGYKNRQTGLMNNVTSWRDPECNSSTLGLSGSRATIIDKIIDINRQDVDVIRPKKITMNKYAWKTRKPEIFVDFETMSDIFSSMDDIPIQRSTDMIFMIGVYWKNKGSWEYKNFICNSCTYEEEYRIMDEFNSFLTDNFRVDARLWYWVAENKFWDRSESRQFELAYKAGNRHRMQNMSLNWKQRNWCDMYKLFHETPIVIKDCFKFGLKPIVRAMNKHGLISTTLDSSCDSGMTAMVKAYRCYETLDNPVECSVMKDIAMYNKFDVQALYDILEFLRNHHK